MSSLKLTSPDFAHGQPIPQRFTCEGDDTSPTLAWEGVPQGTRSLALLVTDPDAPDPAAPKMTFTHWVLYNLPPDSTGLAKGAADVGAPGLNDGKTLGWTGPCPPIGRHRYFFRLLALDTQLEFTSPPTRKAVESACEGHVLGQAELMGTYAKAGAGRR